MEKSFRFPGRKNKIFKSSLKITNIFSHSLLIFWVKNNKIKIPGYEKHAKISFPKALRLRFFLKSQLDRKEPTGSMRTYWVDQKDVFLWNFQNEVHNFFRNIYRGFKFDIKTSLKFSIKRWLDLKSTIDTLFNSSIFKAEWNFYWIC